MYILGTVYHLWLRLTKRQEFRLNCSFQFVGCRRRQSKGKMISLELYLHLTITLGWITWWMPISIAYRGCLYKYIGRCLTLGQLQLAEKISFSKAYAYILNYKLSKLLSLKPKCGLLTDYGIYHHKNYKVTAELTWLKILLLIIINEKLVWEKIFPPLQTHWLMYCCYLKTKKMKTEP